MKQLLILSGKGGTGKTTVAGSFIKLMNVKAYADCDVDAPNLHLITHINEEPVTKDYFGLPKAVINKELCISCDLCREKCRFDAISCDDTYEVDPYACEGCGVCALVCPVSAIEMIKSKAGDIMLFTDESSVFSTAKLQMGSGTSGMLVTEVKKQLLPFSGYADTAVIDGSPGIGCPVIASLSGVDMVLIVAEPSLSGISDLDRIVKTAVHFKVPIAVCVNKYDINKQNTDSIADYCKENDIVFTGVIPYDKMAVEAINSGSSVSDHDCPAGRAIVSIFEKTVRMLSEIKNK